MKITIITLQTLLTILIAPFLSGFIKKIKNNIRMRKGAPVLQPYYNFIKLFSKKEVISENASWIFRITPFIVLASVATALLLVPVFHSSFSLSYMGDFFVIIFLLALGRFFLALAGLDAGSAFGGMGSSREMFISSMVEPVALLSIFVVALNCGSTDVGTISNFQNFKLSSLIAAVSLFTITLAETSRLPIDNQETHLELTMVHEAMILEYSGRSLAIIELAAHIKQIIFFSLLANIILPFGMTYPLNLIQLTSGIALFAGEILVISILIAVIEVITAKMRLFRVVDYLAFSFVLSIMALVVHTMGL